MNELLNVAVPAALQKERELVRARGAVSTLLLVNGMLLATWVSRIPAIEDVRGLGHASFGVALLVVALGAVISMPLAGTLSSRWVRIASARSRHSLTEIEAREMHRYEIIAARNHWRLLLCTSVLIVPTAQCRWSLGC